MSQGERALSIAADVRELERLRQFFEAAAAALGAHPEGALDLLVALNEVATNTIVHGYRGLPGTLEVRLRPLGADLEVRLRDSAPPFDPTSVPPPRIDLPLELRQPGGMGLLLARHYTDELRHALTPEGGNELTLVKRGVLPGPPQEDPSGTHG
jgi:serine/threonine-protein kinase RsbW